MNRRNRAQPGCLQLIMLGIAVGLLAMFYLGQQVPSEQLRIQSNTLSAPVSTSTPVQLAQPVTSTPIPNFSPDIPIGTRLFIPKSGVYESIVRVYLDGVSWDVSKLGQNIGHLQGTSWLDVPGNVVLSGHVELSDGRKGAFANLNELEVGDLVQVEYQGETISYQVVRISTTTPEDLSVIKPTQNPILTLITCGNYDFIQDEYLERLVVVAERIASSPIRGS